MKIIVNGKEIEGSEAVPEFLRKFVQDADKNGIPDFMDQLLKNPMFKMVMGKGGEQLKEQLQKLQNLTPEQKAKVEEALKKLGAVDSSPGGAASASVITVSSGPSRSSKIDYRSLGIPDPEQKGSFRKLLGILGSVVVLFVLGYAATVVFRLFQ